MVAKYLSHPKHTFPAIKVQLCLYVLGLLFTFSEGLEIVHAPSVPLCIQVLLLCNNKVVPGPIQIENESELYRKCCFASHCSELL